MDIVRAATKRNFWANQPFSNWVFQYVNYWIVLKFDHGVVNILFLDLKCWRSNLLVHKASFRPEATNISILGDSSQSSFFIIAFVIITFSFALMLSPFWTPFILSYWYNGDFWTRGSIDFSLLIDGGVHIKFLCD